VLSLAAFHSEALLLGRLAQLRGCTDEPAVRQAALAVLHSCRRHLPASSVLKLLHETR